MDAKVLQTVKTVNKGVVIFDAIMIVILLLVAKQTSSMIMGIIFGSIIAILNFRLLALSLEKAVNLPPGKAQVYTGVRYIIRFTITGAALFVAARNPNLDILTTALGLVSIKIVIFARTLLTLKTKRKEV